MPSVADIQPGTIWYCNHVYMKDRLVLVVEVKPTRARVLTLMGPRLKVFKTPPEKRARSWVPFHTLSDARPVIDRSLQLTSTQFTQLKELQGKYFPE